MAAQSSSTSSRARGFTLLEVMVAVAILGLGLTAIMGAQAGAFSSSAHARNLSVATGLARCKMNELEEQVMRLGYPIADEADQGACCEGDTNPAFKCSWRIELPVLPEAKLGDLDLQASLGGDGGLAGLASLGGLDPTAGQTPGAAGTSSIGGIAQGLAGGLAGLGMGAAPGGGAAAGGMAGGIGGITSMVMGLVYPQLKLIMEASTRRLVVNVSWYEGNKQHSFDVLQWITNPQQGGVVGDLPEGAGVPGAGLFGGGAGTGTGSTGLGSPLGGGLGR
jgi:general secretion pathway protein I